MMKKRRLLVKYMVASVVIVFLLLYNMSYIKFLISRAWYDWVTSYSHTDVVEVNVIETNAMANIVGTNFLDGKEQLPNGYLG